MIKITKDNYKNISFDGIVISIPKEEKRNDITQEFSFEFECAYYSQGKHGYSESGYNPDTSSFFSCSYNTKYLPNGLFFNSTTRLPWKEDYLHFDNVDYYKFDNMEEFCIWYLQQKNKEVWSYGGDLKGKIQDILPKNSKDVFDFVSTHNDYGKQFEHDLKRRSIEDEMDRFFRCCEKEIALSSVMLESLWNQVNNSNLTYEGKLNLYNRLKQKEEQKAIEAGYKIKEEIDLNAIEDLCWEIYSDEDVPFHIKDSIIKVFPKFLDKLTFKMSKNDAIKSDEPLVWQGNKYVGLSEFRSSIELNNPSLSPVNNDLVSSTKTSKTKLIPRRERYKEILEYITLYVKLAVLNLQPNSTIGEIKNLNDEIEKWLNEET